jgi:hypothetical protein
MQAKTLCTLDDCGRPRYKGGLCQHHARKAGLLIPLPPCAVEGCTHKGRTTRQGSVCRKHSAHATEATVKAALCGAWRCRREQVEGTNLCDRHLNLANRCEVRQCALPRAYGDVLCKVHRAKSRTDGSCLIEECGAARHKAQLCGRHASLLEHEIQSCGFPSCDAWVWRGQLCGRHADIGLDFAAGDWFDWVAVEQMFRGQHDRDRAPTALEVLALAEKADRAELQYADLARRLGIEPDRFERWRYHASRLAASFDGSVAA